MLVPNFIEPNSSGGEKLLFGHFRKDNGCKDFIIIHSLFISKHLTQFSGELDFLVLAPGFGIFALEVKHGRVERESGKWMYINRHGKVTESYKGPFRQVSDTMHSLRSYLSKLTEHDTKMNSRVNELLFGSGVMLTGLEEFYDYGTEGEAWQIFTRPSFRVPASHFIDSLSRGFHEKCKRKSWYDSNRSRPSKKDCENLLKLLRGDFHYDYSTLNHVLDSELIIEQFTEEQFIALDNLAYNSRCLIQGGAGTGKTTMAMEWFNRKISEDKKVGLLCYNKSLGEKLGKELGKLKNFSNKDSFAGSFHSYMMGKVDDNIKPKEGELDQFFQYELPLLFQIKMEENDDDEKFDYLIIDESQDILNQDYIDAIDSTLVGGIGSGNWVFFGDFSNQVLYSSDPKQIFYDLTSRCSFARIPPLKVNCRNSKNIVLYNHVTTGCEMQDSPDGMPIGDYVEHYFPVKSKVIPKIEAICKNLLKDGIPEKKVTLLSKVDPKKSGFYNSNIIKEMVSNGMQISSIHSYKGLENSFIIVTGFEELKSDYNISLLYVAISRARLKLFLVFNREIEEAFNNLKKEISIKMTKL